VRAYYYGPMRSKELTAYIARACPRSRLKLARRTQLPRASERWRQRLRRRPAAHTGPARYPLRPPRASWHAGPDQGCLVFQPRGARWCVVFFPPSSIRVENISSYPVYISGRPFVLRDASSPRSALRLSDRAENLEAIETRLKADILAEAAKYGGLLLTHNEAAVSDVADGHAAILPTWTSVDSANVRTMRELMNQMKEQGWSVEVSLFEV
jgi:hypothetical protein